MKLRQSIRFVNMETTFVMFVVFFLLSFPIHGRHHRISSDQYLDNPFRYCSNATFSPNSTYFSNLKSLSSSLSSNASHRLFYHNASATTVYGDYQCRGDLNATACKHCVAKATTNSSQTYCPFSVEAVIWKDECFLRYSNRSFFSLLREEPLRHINNQDNFTGDGLEAFKKIVETTLNDTVRNASSSSSSSHVRLFGTKEASFGSETVYTMAQCTSDLSSSNCRKCLKRAVQIIPSCCSGRRGARVLLFSCTVRYELYPFYDGVSLSISLSPSPAFSPLSSPLAPELAPPAQSPSDTNDPFPELPPPAQSPSNSIPSPPPPDTLPSSPSIPLPPSTAPSSLLSGDTSSYS